MTKCPTVHASRSLIKPGSQELLNNLCKREGERGGGGYIAFLAKKLENLNLPRLSMANCLQNLS